MNQLPIDFVAAKARRDQGMGSSLAHAEDDVPGWADHCLALMRQYACLQGTPWTVEQFRAWAYGRGLKKPDEERAFGGITRKAIKAGVIEKAGYGTAASSNNSPKATYRRPAPDYPTAA